MKKFFMLDGSGYMYRAYHALPVITDKDWHNVNTIYGFFRMVFKLFAQKPDYFFIAWDAPTKTFRHEKFPEYKAQRPKMPQDFKWQVWIIKELVERLEFPCLEAPGYEADDIIYTAVKKYKNPDIQIYIDSLDKDLKQLLSQWVLFYSAMKEEYTDKDKFMQEFGFQPECMLDYLSLLWDASDNIPGVKWVWKKTAQELIMKYCTLDEVYKNLENLSESLSSKLSDNKEMAYQSRDLIALCEVPDLFDNHMSDYLMNLNFDNMKDVLVSQLWFKSMEKGIDELRKRYQAGDQLSLF